MFQVAGQLTGRKTNRSFPRRGVIGNFKFVGVSLLVQKLLQFKNTL